MSKKLCAFVIGNDGLGDMISYSGAVNYIATMYKFVYVACRNDYYKQAQCIFHKDNIIVHPIDTIKEDKVNDYSFTEMMKLCTDIYDLYLLGNYDAEHVDNKTYTKIYKDGTTKKVIHDYPISYYEDLKMPIEIMTKYFSVKYPENILKDYDELLKNYPKYVVIHQIGSNASVNIVAHQKLDIDKILVIDVNNNLYQKGHKFYEIANKFINLPSVIYYAKLLENADALYLMDSCIHALALVVDISKSKECICYKRESRFDYGFDKFFYYNLIFQLPDH